MPQGLRCGYWSAAALPLPPSNTPDVAGVVAGPAGCAVLAATATGSVFWLAGGWRDGSASFEDAADSIGLGVSGVIWTMEWPPGMKKVCA